MKREIEKANTGKYGAIPIYRLGGISSYTSIVIWGGPSDGQHIEGLALYLRDSNNKPLDIFIPKYDICRIANTAIESRRKFWKKFRFPTMRRQ